jgi:hypothetical protein
MKKFLYFIFAIALLTSCEKSKKDILNDNIANYIKQNANVPDSYKSIKTQNLGPVYINNYAESIIAVNNDEIQLKNKYNEDLEQLIKNFEKSNESEKVKLTKEKLNQEKELITSIQKENEKLEKLLKRNRIAFIKVEHSCKLKNKKDEIIEDHLYILTDEDLNVKMVKEKGKNNTRQTMEYFKKNFVK